MRNITNEISSLVFSTGFVRVCVKLPDGTLVAGERNPRTGWVAQEKGKAAVYDEEAFNLLTKPIMDTGCILQFRYADTVNGGVRYYEAGEMHAGF